MAWDKTKHIQEWTSYVAEYQNRQVVITNGSLKLFGGSIDYEGKTYPLRQTEHMFSNGEHFLSVYTVASSQGRYKYACFLSSKLYLEPALVDMLKQIEDGDTKQSISGALTPSLTSLEELASDLSAKRPRL